MVVVACVGLAVVALVFPVRATTLMDEGAKAVSSAAQAGFSPRASDLITREAIYNTWLVGNFGSADSPTATEYGPRLMSALTYTWSDVKAIDADPDVQEDIDKAKAASSRRSPPRWRRRIRPPTSPSPERPTPAPPAPSSAVSGC